MSIGAYLRLLRTPPVGYLMTTSILGRVPLGMTSLAIVLLVSRSGSYSRAGAVLAADVVGAMISGPLLGRAVDRFGRVRVLRPAALVEAALLFTLALLPLHLHVVFLVVAFLTGLANPPLVSAARSLWPSVVAEDVRPTVYAMEATLQELVYIVGPTLVTVLVAVSSARVALGAAGVVMAVGVLAFSAHPALRSPAAAPGSTETGAAPVHPTRRRDSGRRRLTLPLPASLLTLGGLTVASFNFVEISTVRFVRDHHAPTDAGLVLAVWSFGSLMGGLVLGAKAPSASHPRRRLAMLAGTLAVVSILPALAAWILVLGALLFVAGIVIAPTFSAIYSFAAASARDGGETEAFGWLSAGFQAGSAAGAAAAGVIVQHAGPRVGYLCAAAAVAIGVPFLLLPSRRPQAAAAGGEHRRGL